MFGEHHDLPSEFPEYRERMAALAAKDLAFARMYKAYHEIDEELYRIAEQLETPSDAYTEGLKKKRVWLKDRLYAMLRSGGP